MKILMTMYGWDESNAGGGTRFPKQIAKSLQARGHQVLVFYTIHGEAPINSSPIKHHSEDGLKLIGYQHSSTTPFFWGLKPAQDIQDDKVLQHFQRSLIEFKPDMVHFHNFLGLSIGLNQLVAQEKIPSFYSPYNYWLICPTLNLFTQEGSPCQGVNQTGSNCVKCVNSPHLEGHHFTNRQKSICQTYSQYGGKCLASSFGVKELLIKNGYKASQIDVLLLGNERAVGLWNKVGKIRKPHTPEQVHFGFMGAHVSIKGLETLVNATQLLKGDFKVSLYGSGNPTFIEKLKQLDTLKRLQFSGRFKDEDLPTILKQIDIGIVPSICYDHSPLVVSEFQAARIPVIGSHIGGIPDYIQANSGGLFEAQNPKALAELMQKIIDQPTLISKWQQQIKAPLSFEAYIDQLEQRYQQQIQENAPTLHRARIRAFLKERSTNNYQFYQLSSFPQQNFRPVKNPSGNIPFVIDLQPSIFNTHQSQKLLNQSKKLMQFDSDLEPLKDKKLQSKLITLPRYILKPSSEDSIYEINCNKSFKLLSFINIHSESAFDLIQIYLDNFQACDDICLVLMVCDANSDDAHESLINWLNSQQLNPDNIADILLLELESTQQSPLSNPQIKNLFKSCQGLWVNEFNSQKDLVYLALSHLVPLLIPTSIYHDLIELHEQEFLPHDYLKKLKQTTSYQLLCASQARTELWNKKIVETIYQEILVLL